ncbi:septum site-determining protein Ssd [Nocardiopsis sediminis]|uniref:Septum site-determining protein Ssd n=1 Tax=Nocardiopsis sediminis TaxID=1778267 RepID=A0ABV8FZ09_9ACTN
MEAPNPSRPLLVTDDPDLLDDLLRLTAAAAVEPTVAHTAQHAGRDWPRASLIVVGADLLGGVAELEPDPHPLVVVAEREDGPEPRIRIAKPGTAAARIGACAVLRLPHDEPRLADLFAESAGPRTPPAPIVSVVGGRGGAGASTLAIALALAGPRHGADTALIDADPLGGGLDLLIGGEHATGSRWSDLSAREGRMNWAALRTSLPDIRDCAVLTWDHGPAVPIPVIAMRSVLSSAARGADLVVVDLPRALDSASGEALRRSTTALLVVPADLHAVMSAHRLVPQLRQHTGDLRIVVRGACPDLPAETVSHALDLPMLGELPTEPGLARTLDRGDPPAGRRSSPLARFADGIVATLLDRSGGSGGSGNTRGRTGGGPAADRGAAPIRRRRRGTPS